MAKRLTTAETRRLILDWYERLPVCQVAKMAGRSPGTIRNMASAIGMRGLRGKHLAPPFRAHEVEVIRREYGRVPVVHLARQLSRTPAAIHTKAGRLGLGRRRSALWSAGDDAVMRRDYPTRGAAALASTLGRSADAIKHRARRLGLRRDRNEHPWRVDESKRVAATRQRRE
jgi:hypothetical protein